MFLFYTCTKRIRTYIVTLREVMGFSPTAVCNQNNGNMDQVHRERQPRRQLPHAERKEPVYGT